MYGTLLSISALLLGAFAMNLGFGQRSGAAACDFHHPAHVGFVSRHDRILSRWPIGCFRKLAQ